MLTLEQQSLDRPIAMEQFYTDKQHDKQRYEWLKEYQFQKGKSGNPKGRPKGKTLKEFARDYLMSMTDEQRIEFLSNLSQEFIWRMAEGNPHQTKDLTTGGKPIGHLLDELD